MMLPHRGKGLEGHWPLREYPDPPVSQYMCSFAVFVPCFWEHVRSTQARLRLTVGLFWDHPCSCQIYAWPVTLINSLGPHSEPWFVIVTSWGGDQRLCIFIIRVKILQTILPSSLPCPPNLSPFSHSNSYSAFMAHVFYCPLLLSTSYGPISSLMTYSYATYIKWEFSICPYEKYMVFVFLSLGCWFLCSLSLNKFPLY